MNASEPQEFPTLALNSISSAAPPTRGIHDTKGNSRAYDADSFCGVILTNHHFGVFRLLYAQPIFRRRPHAIVSTHYYLDIRTAP
jgi:hypothetical protein